MAFLNSTVHLIQYVIQVLVTLELINSEGGDLLSVMDEECFTVCSEGFAIEIQLFSRLN